MKKYMIGIGIILIGVLFVVLGIIIPNESGSKTIELTMQTNGGVPYEWQYEIKDMDIVEFVKSYEIDNQNKNGLVGAPISINYVFKGIKEGKTTITFKYVSLSDGEIAQEKDFNIKVDNKKNISLIAIP